MLDPTTFGQEASPTELPRVDMQFVDVLSRAIAAASSRASALTDGTSALPYAELDARSAAVQRFVASRDVLPGDVVALETPNTVAGALTLLALLRGGYSVVLLPADRSVMRPALPQFCRHSLIVLGRITDGADVDLDRIESFLAISQHAAFAGPPADPALLRGKLLLRTSGSIGIPKLVVHGHSVLLANARNVIGRLRLRPDDRIAIPVPITHMFGLGAAFLPGLAVGASLGFVEGANVLRYLEHERGSQPTVVFLTPALCTMIARTRGGRDHYRHVVVAGDKLTPEAFEAAERRFRRVANLYGCTELGAITAADPAADHDRRTTTSGTALPGVELRVDAPDEVDDSAPDAGSVACRHPFGFEGYITADGGPWTGPSPLRDGWYRAGDLGRLHPGGLLEVLGREDHSVNRQGRLVMLADVERAMEQLSGVERVVTVLGSDGLRGRQIVAFCVAREGQVLESDALRDACAGLLPTYAIPDQIRIIAGVPMLANGKVDRRSLSASITAPPSQRDMKEPA